MDITQDASQTHAALHTGYNSLQHQASSTCGAWMAHRGRLVLWPETDAYREETTEEVALMILDSRTYFSR